MTREGKLFSHTLLLGAVGGVCKMLTFFLLPLYTATLSPAEFGTADIFVSTAVLLLPVVSLHAPEAVFRFRATGERGALGTGALLLSLGCLLFALFLPLFGFYGVLKPYLLLLYCYVVVSLLRSFLAHALRADGAFLLYALQQVFCAVLTAGLQLLFLLPLSYGVRGYLCAVILADLATFLLILALWHKRLGGLGGATRALCRKMMRYSLPLIPTAVLWWVIHISDRYILLYFHGEAQTGLYAAAGRLPALLTMATGVFLEAWHYAALREREGERSALFGRIYALLLPVASGMAGALMLLSKPLVALLLSGEYQSALTVIPLLCFGALGAGLSNFLDSIYTLRLATRSSLFTALAAAICNVLLNLLLIPPLSGIGAALATAASYFFLFLVRLFHTRRMLSFPRLGVPAIFSLAALLVGALFFAAELPFCGVLAVLLSFFILWRYWLSAVRFFLKRGRILCCEWQKKKNVHKKI